VLALVAALMVHIALILTANLGISLFSTPSNQDRLLTLSLKNTTYEGLKETEQTNKDTVNDVSVSEPAKPTKKIQTEPEVKTVAKTEVKTKVASKQNQISKAVANDAQQNNNEITDLEFSAINKQTSELLAKSSSSGQQASEFISSTNSSNLKVNDQTELQTEDQIENPSNSKALEIDEVEMITKKANHWSSKVWRQIKFLLKSSQIKKAKS